MNGSSIIAELLKAEGVEYLFCFPNNEIIDAGAAVGIRPILTRTERTLVNMADGYSRVTNGNKIGVCAVQQGPGCENAFAGIAQAFSDSVPILLLPGGVPRSRIGVPPSFEAAPAYSSVTKWVAQVNFAGRAPAMLRRAFSLLRSGRPGPVMLEIPADVMTEEYGDVVPSYKPPGRIRTLGDPRDVESAAAALLAAECPLIHVGQGVLCAEATDELVEFAELVQAPVVTTLAGKSAFPENHPLDTGTAAYSGTGASYHFLQKCDLVFGLGCSFTNAPLSTPIPGGKVMVQATIDESDINKEYVIDYPIIGDAKLVLGQLIEAVKGLIGEEGRRGDTSTSDEVKAEKDQWLAKWMPKLTSNEMPLNPYRVIWDLMHAVDRTKTIITHDSGNPRDQLVPFWETLIPRGYIGWGKSTQLGYGLGLAMGAKLGAPENLVINVMGDGAFGMAGMDIETAAREEIPILTIILNNSALGGYEQYLPVAVERYGTKFLTGDYAKVADGLGAYSERVETPDEIVPSIDRAQEAIAGGRPALLEIITKEESDFSKFWR